MLDRDLSWLEFNRRVLHEAVDDRTPLLERALFLTDQRSAWDMQTDGTYVQRRPRGRGTEAGSHVQLMERTRKRRA
jgi:polyphosphate kinase